MRLTSSRQAEAEIFMIRAQSYKPFSIRINRLKSFGPKVLPAGVKGLETLVQNCPREVEFFAA